MVRTEAASPAPKTQGIAASLLNGFAVLEAFSIAEPELGVTEIAERVGLHKSTVSRILQGMAEAGYVERSESSGKYMLGLGLISLAGPLLANLSVRKVAAELLEKATDTTGETTALSVFNGVFPVVVEQVDCPQFVKHTQYVGTRYNRWHSSSFEVAMSYLHADEALSIIGSGEISSAPPVGSSEERRQVLTLLESVRREGIAVNDGLTHPQEFGASAPVHDYDGDLAAVVTISAPRARVEGEHRDLILATVRDTAEQISKRMGYVAG